MSGFDSVASWQLVVQQESSHVTEPLSLATREWDRPKVIEAVVKTGLKLGRAAERLGLTVRQIQRLVARYREHVLKGVASAGVADRAIASSTMPWRFAP